MKVALVGGDSRSARAFARLSRGTAPDIECLAIVRHKGLEADRAHTVVVSDYSAITAETFGGCDSVVNFVGTSSASNEAEYLRVNASLALHLGEAARAAGVSHFTHLSSLSVYGRAELVDQDTPLAPVSAYGRSKLEAERLLTRLDDPAFAVTLLRIPAIYGAGVPSKLGRLAALWRVVRILPAPSHLPRRSIISDRNLFNVLVELLRAPRRGTVLAADPEPFTLEDVRRALPFRAWILPLPPFLFAPIRAAAPSLYASLFAPMEISPDCLLRTSGPTLIPTRQGLGTALGSPDRHEPE